MCPDKPCYFAPVSLLLPIAQLLGGGLLLAGGGDLLVRGATRLASAAGVSSMVVGLTVVAFGTSMPELVTSVLVATLASGVTWWRDRTLSRREALVLLGGYLAYLCVLLT
jgi:cation:H+ antiporter